MVSACRSDFPNVAMILMIMVTITCFLKKPNLVGCIVFFNVIRFWVFFWLNTGFVKRPNLMDSEISMVFQLLE